jgi:hypothetical protein
MKLSVCVALVGVLVSFGTAAQAATYNWSFTSPLASGSGTLDTNVPVGPAQIVGISGVWDSNAITGLLAPNTFGANDNTLLALTPSAALTVPGLSFAVSGTSVNIFSCTEADASFCSPSGDYRFIDSFASASTGTFSVSATPIPAALPLFASALAIIGWAARRRNQKQIA